jgi:hypothetical protein
MQLFSRRIFALSIGVVLTLSLYCSSLLWGQTEQTAKLEYMQFNAAADQAASSGRPLMVLGFTET